jgi:protein-tyrosine phosphatase
MHHLRHAQALKDSLNTSRVEKLIAQGQLNNLLL